MNSPTIEYYFFSPTTNTLDAILKLSTFLIAVANLTFVVYFYFHSFRSSKEQTEKDRKISLFKTLVLDDNMESLHKTFGKIIEIAYELKSTDRIDVKGDINERIMSEFINLGNVFSINLMAINLELYNTVHNISDNVLDTLTINIFDPNIDLKNDTEFETKILETITNLRIRIIATLFEYNGQ